MDKTSADPNDKSFLFLWAKSTPYKQLVSHMVDAGCCAYQYLAAPSSRALLKYLMDQWKCSEADALTFSAYLTSMHDIGKAMPWFQSQDPILLSHITDAGNSALFKMVDMEPLQHEYISSQIFARIWKQRDMSLRVVRPYASVLSLHHQRVQKSRQKISDEWKDVQNRIEACISENYFPVKELLFPECMDATCILLTGLVILSDWVSSSGPFNVYPQIEENYLEKSMQIAKNTLTDYGLISERDLPEVYSFGALWPHITTPRDIQKCCESLNLDALLTIIEAPMGEGKTEAALYLAESMRSNCQKRGIYIALPTQATSNQMYGRTKDMLETIEGGSLKLLHGTAFLMKENKDIQVEDDKEKIEAGRWLGSPRMGLLDENGVGTVDQAMAGVLKSRFSVLRLLGLSNKVLIIDELHAYDAYMSEIIQLLLKWCRCLQIPVILLSATLQRSQRQNYIGCYTSVRDDYQLSEAYPLITQVTKDGMITQVSAKATMETQYRFSPVFLGEDYAQIAYLAVEKIKEGGCYCILVNTVNKAQKIYTALLNLKDETIDVTLFHARYSVRRRSEIERECIRKFGKGEDASRPKKAILVATQVVEQSLDLDFDGMMTELAPVDLLLQRAGRVHRHRGRKRPAGMEEPVIEVILPSADAKDDLDKRYGSSGYIYTPFVLYNTEKFVEEGITIHVPNDMRAVIDKVYSEITGENMKEWQKQAFNQQLMRANADGIAFPEPRKNIFFPSESHSEFVNMEIDDGFEPAAKASTRLGDPTFRISFTNTAIIDAAKCGKLTGKMQEEIFLSSVSLSMRSVKIEDLMMSDVYRISSGQLYGCFLTSSCERIRIGNKYLVNDTTLGFYWEE